MFQKKSKFKLSKNLKLGIEGPSSQGTFFKVGGVFFLGLSLVLAWNIFHSLSNKPAEGAAPAVLGAFDQSTTEEPTTYTVQRGDTLFNVAQQTGVNWVVIATLNDLKAPYNLKPGAVLKLQ